jgi:hypothetical protein
MDEGWCSQWGVVSAALLALVVPCAATAQTVAPALPRFDVAALAGWVGGEAGNLPGNVYREWDGTSFGALAFGVYWTEHLKTELEVGSSGERDVYGSERLDVGPGTSRFLYYDHHIASRGVSLTQAYQFLHNTWVHPFAGAGLELEWERRRTGTQLTTGSPPFVNERLPETIDRALRVRAAVSTGFKAYFSSRAFFRTDVRLGVGTGLDTAKWRVGGGFDF